MALLLYYKRSKSAREFCGPPPPLPAAKVKLGILTGFDCILECSLVQIITIVLCIKILKKVYNLTRVTTLAICLWINCLFLYYIWKYIYPISIEIHVTLSKFILHILRASSSSPVAVLASFYCTARRISYQSSRACFLLVNRVEVHYKSAWLTFSAVSQQK